MRVKYTAQDGSDEVIKGKLYYDKEMERWSINCGTFRRGNKLFECCPGFCEKKDARYYRVNEKREIVDLRGRAA